MSDKITKQEVITRTVTYKIEPSGDCQECKSYKQGYCPVFDCSIADNNWKQCNSCKDYLAEQKSRVYCDGCGHFWAKRSFGELEPRCALDHEQKGEMYNYYSNNCQDWGE